MAGSSGTVGALVTQHQLLSGSKNISMKASSSLMGLIMLVCSLSVTLVCFPQWGGMLWDPLQKQMTKNHMRNLSWLNPVINHHLHQTLILDMDNASCHDKGKAHQVPRIPTSANFLPFNFTLAKQRNM